MTYEYKVVTVIYSKMISGDKLNELGNDGWELVSAFPWPDMSFVMCTFKRPKE